MVEVQQLKDELDHTKNELTIAQNTARAISDFADGADGEAAAALAAGGASCEVVLRVAPQKADQITTQVINGRRCIVIPMEENEHASINGEELAGQTEE